MVQNSDEINYEEELDRSPTENHKPNADVIKVATNPIPTPVSYRNSTSTNNSNSSLGNNKAKMAKLKFVSYLNTASNYWSSKLCILKTNSK